MPTNTDPKSIFVTHRQASYDGVKMFFVSGEVFGGLKTVKKEFLNSDNQTIEILGNRVPSYRVKVITGEINKKITAEFQPPSLPGSFTVEQSKLQTTYVKAKEDLLEKIREKKPKTFIHPTVGKIKNVVIANYTLNESMAALGIAEWTLDLEIDGPERSSFRPLISFNPSLIKQLEGGVFAAVGEALEEAQEEAGFFARIGAKAKALFGPMLNAVKSATSKIMDAVASVTDAIAQASQPFLDLVEQIGEIQENIATIIAIPQRLAQELFVVFNQLDGIFATGIELFGALQNMFDFDLITDFDFGNTRTSLALQRRKNTNSVRLAVRSLALTKAYSTATDIPLDTIERIDEVALILENQFQRVINDELASSELKVALLNQRDAFLSFLETQRLTARQVITVEEELTTPRLLSFKFTGSSEDGELISRLNGVSDESLEGSVKVITV